MILQRVILVLGVLAALTVTFVFPPKLLHGIGGARSTVLAECGVRPVDFAALAGVPGESSTITTYNQCAAKATVETSTLLVYLAVIVGATAGLSYAVSYRGVSQSRPS